MARFTGSGSGSGIPGPTGPQGDSAYEIAVENGFVGTEQEWLDSLGGGTADLGDFTFTDNVAAVNNAQNMILNTTNGEDFATKAQLVLDPNNYAARLIATDNFRTSDFTTGDWVSATWTTDGGSGSYISFVNAVGLINYLENTISNQGNVQILVNGAALGDFIYYNLASPDVTIYIGNLGPSEDPTVSSIQFQYTPSSKIEIDYDEGDILIDGKGLDVIVRSDDDIYIEAGGDDLFLRASDDIRFTANWASSDGLGDKLWRMDANGQFQLPGDGYISNPIDSSGDGYNNDTMHLVPDSSLESDQYIILDPTSPNHIHIRPGGTIDGSTAELYIGGERTHVVQDDGAHEVRISTGSTININTYLNINGESNSNFIAESGPIMVDVGYKVNVDGIDYVVAAVTPDTPAPGNVLVSVPGATFQNGQSYTFRGDDGTDNNWMFGSDGYLYGPNEGGLYIQGIDNPDSNLYINSGNSITLSGASGEFLNDSEDPNNQIATIGDISNEIPNVILQYSPTFTATGLTFTGSGTTYPTYNSFYVKSGKMVSFAIEVNLSTVTNFGTGQYKLQLPFTPAFGHNHFSGWANVDPAANPDVPNGHVILNVDHAGLTDVLDLHYLKQAGGAHTPIIEGLFLQGTPVTLTASSKIYVSGTYIAQ